MKVKNAIKSFSAVASLILGTSSIQAATLVDEFDPYEQYLVAESDNGFYYEVSGDGYERGFEVKFSLIAEKGLNSENIVSIEIPTGDNYADCAVGGVQAEDLTNSGPFYTTYNVSVQFETAVEGDSGGCLALIKSANGQTAAVARYDYVTDY